MRLLRSPAVNRIARTVLSPFAAFVPERLRFPVAGRIRVSPPGGEPFGLACNATSYLAKVIFWGGVQAFEPELVRVVRHLAPTTHTFADAGANIGYYSLLVRAYNPAVEVVAFEPSPDPHRVLLQNCPPDERTRVEAVALGDQSGTTTFYPARNPRYPDEPQLGGSGSVDAEHTAHHGAGVAVDVETLDAALARDAQRLPVGLLKVDVEGAELGVLRGAAGVLARDRPVVLVEALGRSGTLPDILALFEANRYRVYLATDAGLVAPDADSEWTNYVAVPAEQTDRVTPLLA